MPTQPPSVKYQPVPSSYGRDETGGWWTSGRGSAGGYTEQPPYSSAAIPGSYAYSPGYQSQQQYQMGPGQTGGYPYADVYAQNYQEYATAGGNYAAPAAGPGIEAVKTEMRKVIVKQLPSFTTTTQLQNLIKKQTNISANKILDIDLPTLPGSSGTIKGHACVILDSEETASRVIKLLNGHKYGGCSLQVGLTKEGVSMDEGRGGYHHHSSRPSVTSSGSHRSGGGPREGKDGDKREKNPQPRHPASEKDKKGLGSAKQHSSSQHHGSDIIVAHGSRNQEDKKSKKSGGKN